MDTLTEFNLGCSDTANEYFNMFNQGKFCTDAHLIIIQIYIPPEGAMTVTVCRKMVLGTVKRGMPEAFLRQDRNNWDLWNIASFQSLRTQPYIVGVDQYPGGIEKSNLIWIATVTAKPAAQCRVFRFTTDWLLINSKARLLQSSRQGRWLERRPSLQPWHVIQEINLSAATRFTGNAQSLECLAR